MEHTILLQMMFYVGSCLWESVKMFPEQLVLLLLWLVAPRGKYTYQNGCSTAPTLKRHIFSTLIAFPTISLVTISPKPVLIVRNLSVSISPRSHLQETSSRGAFHNRICRWSGTCSATLRRSSTVLLIIQARMRRR